MVGKNDNKNTLSLSFSYAILYSNGRGYDSEDAGFVCVIDVEREAYIKIAKYVAANGDLNAAIDPEIQSVVSLMNAHVRELDMYHSMSGKWLNKSLKKPREIEKIEVRVEYYELERFRRMGDIDAVFARPEQNITLVRYDGSTFELKLRDGMAEIRDSKKPNEICRIEEDRLIY